VVGGTIRRMSMGTFVALCVVALAAAVAGALAMRATLLPRLAHARAELAAERRLGIERATAAARDEERLSQAFAVTANEALARASSSFLDLARATLGRETAAAAGDLDARRQAVEALVSPLHSSLDKVERQLAELEAARRSAYARLTEQVRSLAETQERLRGETAGLVTALRAPSVRGRWGELQLRRVVEMAGMVEHCDFVEQPSFPSPDGVLRPDVVVRLPGGGSVVVDAKVPLQGYLAVLDALDEPARRQALVDHARQLRTHVDALSRKAYWERVQPAPELVVLFVPGEPILSAALEQAPELYEHAVASSVLLATPTSLIALLRTVAYGWRQEAMAANARAVCDLGRQLHGRLGTLVDHVSRLGRQLDGAVSAYNEAVGSLESRVLVAARRFTDLSVTETELAEPGRIDRSVRAVAPAELAEPAEPAEPAELAGPAGSREPTALARPFPKAAER
jgi:DNA recombination protein RmuC